MPSPDSDGGRLRRTGYRSLIAGLLAASSLAALAAPPRIGLALSGGGARGAAHIGVLEVLEELRVPVDCIAGTSMGAIVGGAYAGGVSPRTMRQRVQDIDWDDVFTDRTPRDYVPPRRKQIDQRYLPGLELGLKDGHIEIARGVITGQKLDTLMNRLTSDTVEDREISSLPMPFRAVATDLVTGERVVFKDGSLAAAVRSSMSVPGAVSPGAQGGRQLVDGGLTDNLPIDVARDTCADVVIAVDVGTPLSPEASLTSPLAVTNQMIGILIGQNVAAQLATLRHDDVLLRPEIPIANTDFDRQAEAIEAGRKAALAVADTLKQYALPPAAYAAWQTRMRVPAGEAPRLDEIRIAGLDRTNPDGVQRQLSVPLGQPLDQDRLSDDLLRVYATGDYERVDYDIRRIDGHNRLDIWPVEKSWGPDYLRFGLYLQSDFERSSSFNLRAAYHRTWLNERGGEWLSEAQIGRDQRLSTEFYQPIDRARRWFIAPSLSWRQWLRDLYVDDAAVAEYQARETLAEVDLGVQPDLSSELRLGLFRSRASARSVLGVSPLPSLRADSAGVRLRYLRDTLDRAFAPSDGSRFAIDFKRVLPRFGSQTDYGKLEVDWTRAWRFGRHTLLAEGMFGRGYSGDIPGYDQFTLGGLFRLSGYAPDQLIGEGLAFGRLALQTEVARLPGGLGGPVYAGLSLEGGRLTRQPLSGRGGWILSGALYLGTETALGPLYLAWGRNQAGQDRFYLMLGQP